MSADGSVALVVRGCDRVFMGFSSPVIHWISEV